MKTLCRATMVNVFVLLCISIMQAQTPNVKIDQVAFMQKFIGTWKAEAGEDTIMVVNVRPYGKGSERDLTLSTKGKVISTEKMLYGYDEVNDKIIGAVLSKSSPNLMIYAWWGISQNKSEGVLLKDISNPENAAFKMKCILISPDEFTMTYTLNNKVVGEWTFVRQIK